jgi:serine/threonine protein kinase
MDTQQRKFPEFNQKFQILNSLGEGNTSKVYLGQTKEKPRSYAAIKLLREEFLNRDEDSIKSVENEVIVLKNLQHKNIVNILDFGDQGFVLKPSGREIKNLVYILLEYVQGGLLFDIC